MKKAIFGLLARLRGMPSADSMNIATRLHAGFGLVLALLLVLGGMGWYHTGALAARTQSLVETDYQLAVLAKTMQKAVSDMALSVAQMSLTGDVEDVKFESQNLKRSAKAYDDAAKELQVVAAASVNADTLTVQLKAVEEMRLAAYGLMDQISTRALSGTGRDQIADFTATQLRPPQEAWFASLDKLLQSVDGTMRAAATQSHVTAERVRVLMVIAVVLALAIGVAAAWWISRSIAKPLAQAVVLARAVAQGDLSAALSTTRRDEIGELLHALEDMQTGLRSIVGDIRLSADSIHHASGEVASGNSDLSQRTELTASNLQQAAASMQQLTGSVHHSAHAASKADELAAEAASAAQRGGSVVQEVVGNMQAIATSSRKIADITSVIDGIAFQTNLLALNAAVEAARAGEQGRGFAVVAGEVRTLAQRAAGAAKEIKTLIGASVERVESGSKLVQGAGASMNEIVGAVQRVAGVISEIRDATRQQSTDIGSVNEAVVQVDTMTQQNSALVEQSAAAAALLSEQAARLNGLIGSFRLTEQQPA